MSVAVNIDRVSKWFANTRAVDAVSLHIAAGELFFLLGPSGCGKTTLLRCLAGFYTPDEGSIRIGDRDVTLLPPHVRDTGMVFQSYALWPHFTVAQNVSFGLEMRGVARPEREKRVDEALELVRMRDRAKDKPNQLSGGQQQRVALARALVVRPQCLLLDEPLSNLDASLREEMRLELKELQTKTGITTIFVTHDQTEAMVMSDLIVIMNHGRVEQIGTPQEIYEAPANQFVASFVGVSNFLEGELLDNPNADSIAPVRIGQNVLQCRADGKSKGESVLVCVRPEDWEVSKDRPPGGVLNAIESSVEKAVYMGGTSELWVRYSNSLIRIQGVQLPEAAIGDTLYLSTRPQNIILIDQAHRR